MGFPRDGGILSDKEIIDVRTHLRRQGVVFYNQFIVPEYALLGINKYEQLAEELLNDRLVPEDEEPRTIYPIHIEVTGRILPIVINPLDNDCCVILAGAVREKTDSLKLTELRKVMY